MYNKTHQLEYPIEIISIIQKGMASDYYKSVKLELSPNDNRILRENTPMTKPFHKN